MSFQEPAEEANVTNQEVNDEVDIPTLVQNEVMKLLGALDDQPQDLSFEDVLTQIDPRDSDAALLMLDFLLKTGRLHRIGVLDGGHGYLFTYQEPKGASKQGYTPGATQGDRIVDKAVEQQRATSSAPAKRSVCVHCMQVVVEQDGTVSIDESDGEGVACDNSPTGLHVMA